MSAPTSLSLTLLLPMMVFGCSREPLRTATLKDGASLVCDPSHTFTLRSLPGGRYGLMAAAVDSAHLHPLLRNVLPPTPGPRVLIVDVAPDRVRDIQWLVPLVEAEGYAAYEPDAACEQGLNGPFFASANL